MILPLALALSLAASPAPGDVRLAVVAGNNRGLDGEARLEFAEQDARRVLAVLTELGAVSERNAKLVLGGGPEDLMRALGAMVGQAQVAAGGTPVTLLLYVSSHADAENLHLGGKLLPLATIRALLDRTPARLRVSVIDGCRLTMRAALKGGEPSPTVPVVVDRSARVDGDVFISAASPGELAAEWSALRGSLFTHHLLTGLRGAADLDRDGRVTLAEAYAFAYRATLARAAEAGMAPQHPSFDFRLAGFGDWVFTWVGARGAEIALADPLSGRFWITDQRSDVVAEVDKRAGDPLRLSVAPGRYRVVRLAPEWVEAADVILPFGGVRRIEPGSLVRVRAERALAKGGPGLELRPWSLVAGWAVATRSTPGMSAQQAGELGVERALGAWRARLLVGGGWSSTTAERAELRQRELRLPAAATWTFPWSLATVGFGVEVRPRVLWQEGSRTVDAGTLGSPLGSRNAFLLAGGPLASVSFPVHDRVGIGLEVWGGYESAPDEQGRRQTRALAQGSVRASWKL